jgi:hypothetical protein
MCILQGDCRSCDSEREVMPVSMQDQKTRMDGVVFYL